MWLLIDAFGSEQVSQDFLQPLRDAGVHVGIFNPKRLLRLSFRNHRKLLAVDGAAGDRRRFQHRPRSTPVMA